MKRERRIDRMARRLRHQMNMLWIRLWCGRAENTYWWLRCRIGLHQRNLYVATLTGKAVPWCAWCNTRIGKAEPLTDNFEGIIAGFCQKKTRG